MNLLINLLVDGEYTGQCQCYFWWGKAFACPSLTNSVRITLLLSLSVSPTDLEVQVVGLIKIIIDPEAIMTETAVSAHYHLTLLRHQLTYKPYH